MSSGLATLSKRHPTALKQKYHLATARIISKTDPNVLKAVVLPVLRHGCKTLTLRAEDMKRQLVSYADSKSKLIGQNKEWKSSEIAKARIAFQMNTTATNPVIQIRRASTGSCPGCDLPPKIHELLSKKQTIFIFAKCTAVAKTKWIGITRKQSANRCQARATSINHSLINSAHPL